MWSLFRRKALKLIIRRVVSGDKDDGRYQEVLDDKKLWVVTRRRSERRSQDPYWWSTSAVTGQRSDEMFTWSTRWFVTQTSIQTDNSDWTDHLSISVYHGLTDATAATLTSNPIQATPTADISPRRGLIGLSTVLEATDVIREMWSWRRSLFHSCFHSSAASCLVHTALPSWRLQSVTEKLQAQSQFVLTLCLMLALTLTWEPEKAHLSFNYLLIILTSGLLALTSEQLQEGCFSSGGCGHRRSTSVQFWT